MGQFSVVLLVVCSISFSTYAQNQNQPIKPNEIPNQASPQAQQKTVTYFSENEIAQMLKEINQAEIELGQLAQKKAKSTAIKTMAQQSEKDHKGLDTAMGNLLKRSKLQPTESEGSRALKSMVNEEQTKMKDLKGEDFDKAYLNYEMTFHKRARDLVEASLLPNAKDNQWKELLTKTHAVLVSHLQHAQTLQSQLQLKK